VIGCQRLPGYSHVTRNSQPRAAYIGLNSVRINGVLFSFAIAKFRWLRYQRFHDRTKSGILKFPSGMAGKRQKIGKIPPKAGRLAAM